LTEKLSNSTLNILDSQGKIVLSTSLNDALQKVNVSHLQQGVYFISVSNNSQIVATKRFIKIN
jgi:hypothetical protein